MEILIRGERGLAGGGGPWKKPRWTPIQGCGKSFVQRLLNAPWLG